MTKNEFKKLKIDIGLNWNEIAVQIHLSPDYLRKISCGAKPVSDKVAKAMERLALLSKVD